MFIPKGQTVGGIAWNETMFWNVYYVKGAFLSADAAYEVMQGIRTLGVRMLTKCINTQILARFFDAHPQINVQCNVLPRDENSQEWPETFRFRASLGRGYLALCTREWPFPGRGVNENSENRYVSQKWDLPVGIPTRSVRG